MLGYPINKGHIWQMQSKIEKSTSKNWTLYKLYNRFETRGLYQFMGQFESTFFSYNLNEECVLELR